MAELAPVDEYGMPYLLHPYEAPSHKLPTWKDDDHSFYQNGAPELSDEAGRALRHCRVQTVERWLHNNKHRAFPDGTALPAVEQDKFALIILSCAGYVARAALDVRDPDNPRLVRTSRSTHEYLRGRRQLHTETRRDTVLGYRTEDESRKKIGRFIASYVKRQEIDDIDESIIDQFLNTPNARKRRRLGNVILGHSIRVAVNPVADKYRQALKAGLIRPVKKHPVGVVLQLFPQDTWPDYHGALEERFSAA